MTKFLLVAAAVAVATAAAVTAQTPVPPLPFSPLAAPPLDIPPCLSELMPCAYVYENSSAMAECCDTIERILKNDRACICDAIAKAAAAADQLALNQTDNGMDLIPRCKISGVPANICNLQGPAGSQHGHAVCNTKLIGIFGFLGLLLFWFFVF